MVADRGTEGYQGELRKDTKTIAERIKASGYSTYCVGKWHVTPTTFPDDEAGKHNWPLQRGFDRYYGIINGASSLWDPNSLVRGNKMITIKNDPEYQPQEAYHFTDAVSDNAVKFIDEHAKGEQSKDKPFFMYVAYTAAHWPMHARPRDIKKYDGRYDGGYEPIRAARFEKMKRIGVISKDAELSEIVGNWDDVEDKEWESACMEVYAAMVDQMDQGIGRIVDSLKANNQLDNTLIMFMQDNGGCAETCGRKEKGPRVERADKPSLPLIGDDVLHYQGSRPAQTRDGWPVMQGHVMPGPADTYIGYGRNWANVSNTPFREYKHFVHEGGIATPMIAHWPKGFSAKGEIRDEPSHLVDLLPTCLDVAKANEPLSNTHGLSLLPVFRDLPIDREMIFFEHEGNRALRIGDWKAVAKAKHGDDAIWELYDVAKDRSELHDLAESDSQRLNEMKRIWRSRAVEVKAIPWPVSKKQKQSKNKERKQSKEKKAG